MRLIIVHQTQSIAHVQLYMNGEDASVLVHINTVSAQTTSTQRHKVHQALIIDLEGLVLKQACEQSECVPKLLWWAED